MTCGTSSDCPGDETTTCQDFGEYSTCVNSNYMTAGLCPDTYICGETATPPIEDPGGLDEDQPRDDLEPEPWADDDEMTTPNDDLSDMENQDCLTPDVTGKFDELCQQAPPTITPGPVEARPTVNPFAGGCNQTWERRPVDILFTLLFFGAFSWRRRRGPSP